MESAVCGHSAGDHGLLNGALGKGSGSLLAPPPTPRAWALGQICLLWCLGGKSEHGRGRAGAGVVSPRVLAWCACALFRPVRTPWQWHHTPHIACGKHQKQQWHAGEGMGRRRWERLRAWSRGCACTQACGRLAMRLACICGQPLFFAPPPFLKVHMHVPTTSNRAPRPPLSKTPWRSGQS